MSQSATGQGERWFDVSSRGKSHAILTIDSVGVGIRKGYAHAVYGIDYRIRRYRQFDHKRSIGYDDYENLLRILTKRLQRAPAYYATFARSMTGIAQAIIARTDAYRATDWTRATTAELQRAFAEMLDLQSRLWGGGMGYTYYFVFNDVVVETFAAQLREKLGAAFATVFRALSAPEHRTAIGEEQLALLSLAQRACNEGHVPEAALRDHWERYAYLNKYYFWGEGYTLADMRKRLEELTRKGQETVTTELRRLTPPPLDLSRWEFSDRERTVIASMQKAAYASNFADEATNYFAYHLRPLLDAIAERFGIAYGELVSMRIAEVLKSLRGSTLTVPQEVLRERLDDHALIFTDGQGSVLTGTELETYRKAQQTTTAEDVRELRGMVATNGGRIRGAVRILCQAEDVEHLQVGEILVAAMTNPTFVPAMQRSAAIVTDEGGLLSHAAIVSRELGVPCIIGTKIATKVLHDGDLVEVDAEKGVVRIVKRAA